MRTIGKGVSLYAIDHAGELPRSFHSAGARGEAHWPVSVAPYLEIFAEVGTPEWASAFEKLYRCPTDKSTDITRFSYAMNVFYELDPSGDDYLGSPARWRTISSVPRPSQSILLGESRSLPFGDHFMCHQWSKQASARNAIDSLRHGKSSNYLFIDGHSESLPIEQTFDPAKNINRWNPALAK
jgi:prepilin-type processing-associated H-X9-DG protein